MLTSDLSFVSDTSSRCFKSLISDLDSSYVCFNSLNSVSFSVSACCIYFSSVSASRSCAFHVLCSCSSSSNFTNLDSMILNRASLSRWYCRNSLNSFKTSEPIWCFSQCVPFYWTNYEKDTYKQFTILHVCPHRVWNFISANEFDFLKLYITEMNRSYLGQLV